MADQRQAASARWRKIEKHLVLRYQQQLLELGTIENKLHDALHKRDSLLRLLETQHLGSAFPFALITRRITDSIDLVKQMEAARAEQVIRVHQAKNSVDKAAHRASSAWRLADRERTQDLSVEAASRTVASQK